MSFRTLFPSPPRLSLHNNQITDTTPLSALTGLTEYLFPSSSHSFYQIIFSTTIIHYPSLPRLWLDHNQITDTTPLSALTGLTVYCFRSLSYFFFYQLFSPLNL